MSRILYVNPLSPFANKCAIALDEKSVPYERRTPANFGGTGDDPAFLRASPFGEVPALVDDGFAIFDSHIIFDYIDHRFGDAPLLAASPRERAKALMIERVLDSRYDPINWGITELLHLGRVTGGAADAVRLASERRAAALNSWLEGHLGGEAWFAGEAFGAADIFVGVHLNGAASHGLIAPSSPLMAWLDRVNARSSFAEAQRHARTFMSGLTPESFMRWMTVPRQYRDARLEWVVKIAGLEVVAEGLAANRIWFSRELGQATS